MEEKLKHIVEIENIQYLLGMLGSYFDNPAYYDHASKIKADKDYSNLIKGQMFLEELLRDAKQ